MNPTRLRSVFTAAWAVGAIGGVLVGALVVRAVLAGPDSDTPSDSAALGLPRPTTIDDLVANYNIIVIGVIEGIQRTDTFRPSGLQNPNGPPLPTAPLTFFDLYVERVVSAPPEIQEGTIIALRMWGPPDSPTSGNMLMPKAGQRRLFVLRLQPDGISYGTTDGIFDLSGKAVTYADENRTPVRSFTDKTAPEAFIQALKEARDRAPALESPVIPPTATPRP